MTNKEILQIVMEQSYIFIVSGFIPAWVEMMAKPEYIVDEMNV